MGKAKKVAINAFELLYEVRKQAPVVHHLTNWVTISDCANIVKAFGASPVMAHAKEEAAQMAGIASSLVLNIGTLTPDFIEAMKIAARSANAKAIPVVLDVCGAGATGLRDTKSRELLEEVKIDIIKGNASEIARVAGEDVKTRGVDAGSLPQDLVMVAKRLAGTYSAVVAVTGKVDIVTNGAKTYYINNGVPLMAKVVGTGCMAASVIGTFAAVECDLAYAAVAGLVCFEIAAERAAKKSSGPGSFKQALFDCAYHLDKKTVDRLQKVEA